MTRVVVQPFLDDRQVLVTPFGFFLDVLQRFFDNMLGASELSLPLDIKLLHHVVAFLSRKYAGCSAYQIIPQVRLVCEPIATNLVVLNKLKTNRKIILLNLYGFPVFLKEVEKCRVSR